MTSTLLKSSDDLGWSTCLPSFARIGSARAPDLSRRMPKSRLRFVVAQQKALWRAKSPDAVGPRGRQRARSG
jgi:hypothetical protein